MRHPSLTAVRWATAVVAAAYLAACGPIPPPPPPPDATPGDDAPVAVDLTPGRDATDPPPPPLDGGGPSFCARALCGPDTPRCCESLMRCIAADARCPDDPPPPPVDAGPGACRSNADCGRAQYCAGATCDGPGACQVRPDACPELYAPVCGCDGRTYGNACEAASGGVRVASRGECAVTSFCATVRCAAGTRCCEATRSCLPGGVLCPPELPDAGPPPVDVGPTGCVTARDCGARQECVYPDSVCARSGTCQDAIACLRAETFCSCTGETYLGCRPDRPTIARRACPGVDAGVDAPTPACRSNTDCGRGQYCAGAGCDAPGTRAARPEACTLEYNPVCGCDGRTYGNACGAANAGVRVASRGECVATSFCAAVLCVAGTRCCEATRSCLPGGVLCPSEPPDAGPPPVDAGPAICTTVRDCGARQECVYPSSACARGGTCQDAIACLRAETFCACDGTTYFGCRPDRPTRAVGACAAADAGVPSCRSNADCRTGYCAGVGCDTAGTCEARPEICTREYSPVCGCDGRTYGNACTAASAGVRVTSRGECPAPSFCATVLCAAGTRCCEALRACQPAGVLCPTEPPADGGVASCTTARDCGGRQECVFPSSACARTGTCQAAIACLRAETFCSCAGETYLGCRPDRPTLRVGACR